MAWFRTILTFFIMWGYSATCLATSKPLSDPTRPRNLQDSQSVTEKTTNFQLTAIINKSNHKVAIINGSLLKKGDHLGGMSVKDIADSEVVIYSSEGTRTLRLITHRHGKKIIKHRNQ